MMMRLHLTLVALVATASPALAAGGGWSFGIEGYYILDFVIFVGLIWFFVKGPARKFLEERHDRIKEDMESATRLKEAAEAELATYEAKRAGLAGEVAELRAGFQTDGVNEQQRLMNEASAAAAKMRGATDVQLEQQAAQVRSELEIELIDQVLTSTEEKVRAKMTSVTQRQLFEAYVAELEKLENLDQFAA